jgi:hypothetical protein
MRKVAQNAAFLGVIHSIFSLTDPLGENLTDPLGEYFEAKSVLTNYY